MEALGRLARRLGHDLNNTFGVILNTVEMTRDGLPAESPLQEDLALAQEALQDVQSATGWLAVFHRREARDRVPLDLCRATVDALQVLEVILPDDIELVTDARCRPEPWVHVSLTQLRRVLFAVVVAARERLAQGGILRVTVAGDDAGLARVAVGYTPDGLAAAGAPEIEAAVRDLGGEVSFDSDTSLEIILPVIPAPEAAGAPHGRGEVILVGDANSYLRRMIATELTARGYSVLQAADRTGLLEHLERRRGEVRLLIVDQDLPGGVEGLQPGTPMVLVTPSAERGPGSRTDGRTRRLSKPFQLAELTSLAGSLLCGREDRR
jgi:CheY-like chemotaxis protein